MNEENESTPSPEENEAASEPQEETSTPEPVAEAEAPAEEPKAEEPAKEEETPAAEPEAQEEAEVEEEKSEPKAETAAKEEPKAEEASEEASDAEVEEEKPVKKEETAEDLLKSELAEVKIRRAKGSKNITHGIVNIMATFNNTKVNITDMKGNTISWSSSGKCNFRGSRKSTAYAAQVVTMDAGRVAMSHGLKEVVVKVCGPGMGRDSAVRALQSLGLTINSIVDVTPVPHNGCRPPKRRRV